MLNLTDQYDLTGVKETINFFLKVIFASIPDVCDISSVNGTIFRSLNLQRKGIMS